MGSSAALSKTTLQKPTTESATMSDSMQKGGQKTDTLTTGDVSCVERR